MTDKDPHVIGARIARRRHQLGWSQVELAQRLGVSPSSVANWERGASYPKKKWGKVEQVLGMTLDDPADRSPPAPPRELPPDLQELMREEVGDELAAALIAHYGHIVSGRTPPASGGAQPRGSAGKDRRSAG